ncbi:MAG: glycosyltransferase [Muribaculaceae bacterium]|nr:glycosyltransferase [Muribaculaceae bacterium]
MPSTTICNPRGIPFKLSKSELSFRPILSLVIPVYNGGIWFKRLIENICLQLDKDKDLENKIEVILSIDAPTDGSDNIALEASYKYPAIIKSILHDNVGLVGNRNIGMQLAQGEYIIFADHDDLFSENAFSKIIGFLEKYNPDILCFRARVIDGDDKHLQFAPKVPEGLHSGRDHILMGGLGFGTIWDLAIKNELIRKNNLYSLKYWLSEDWTLRVNALMIADKVLGVNDTLYQWRQAGESASHNAKANQKYFEAKIFYLINHLNTAQINNIHDYKAWNIIFLQEIRYIMAVMFRSKLKLNGLKIGISRTRFFFRHWLKKFGKPKDITSLKIIGGILLLPYAGHIGKLVMILRKIRLMRIPYNE